MSMLKRTTKRQGMGDEDGVAPVPLRFRDDPLVWAGWLYVHDGLTQNDIAAVMGVSRATVNGYLGRGARARHPFGSTSIRAACRATETAQALKQRFGLADCVVIPGDDGGRPLVQRLGEAGGSVLRNLSAGRRYARRSLEPNRHGGRRLCGPARSFRTSR